LENIRKEILVASLIVICLMIFIAYSIFIFTNVFVINQSIWNPYTFGGMPHFGSSYPYWNLYKVLFNSLWDTAFYNPVGLLLLTAAGYWFCRTVYVEKTGRIKADLSENMSNLKLLLHWAVWFLIAYFVNKYILIGRSKPYEHRHEVLGITGPPMSHDFIFIIFWTFVFPTAFYLPVAFVYYTRITYSKLLRIRIIDNTVETLRDFYYRRLHKKALSFVSVVFTALIVNYFTYFNLGIVRGYFEGIETKSPKYVIYSGDWMAMWLGKSFPNSTVGDVWFNPYPYKIKKFEPRWIP